MVEGSRVQLNVADSGRAHMKTPGSSVRSFLHHQTGRSGHRSAFDRLWRHSQSDGSIYLDSAPGLGTTVRIYLPRAFGTATAAPAASTEPVEGGAETVLLVEDEEGLRQLLKTVLEGAGYRVLEAGSGRQALDLSGAHSGPIDIIVSDVVMPGIGGRELVERIALASRSAGFTDLRLHSDRRF